jgi:hypothetical protein
MTQQDEASTKTGVANAMPAAEAMAPDRFLALAARATADRNPDRA